MKVKFKKLHSDAVIPTKAHETDAGFDLVATSKSFDKHGNVVYGTALAVEIPKGYVGYVFPRSSNANKNCLLSNSVGVIDSGYRGEIMAKFRIDSFHLSIEAGYTKPNWFKNLIEKFFPVINLQTINVEVCRKHDNLYNVGDRIAQLIIMPRPNVEFIECDELSETDRGEGGYGSSGK